MRKKSFFLALAACLSLFCAEAAGGRRHRAHADALVPYGSPHMQKLQNLAVKPNKLPRYKRIEDLEAAIDAGKLVKIVDTSSYTLETVGSMDPDHAGAYAHAQPWVKDFLDDELAPIAAKYGKFKVTSLVRTQAYQRKLCGNRHEGAICGSVWWKQSSHLTGSTVDISRKDLDSRAASALEARLSKLRKQGKIIAIKEDDCYHVMVLRSYSEAEVVKRRKPAKHGRHTKQQKSHPSRRHRKTRH